MYLCVCRSIFCDNIQQNSRHRSRFIGKRKSDFLFLFVSSIFQFFFCFFLLFQHTDTRVCVFCLTENHLYCYNCITVAICFLFGYYSCCCCCLKREKKIYTTETIKFILSLFDVFFLQFELSYCM